MTSLTVDEFEALAPLVQKAFVAHMEARTLEGKPRNGRWYSQYATCPLPTPEDRLLFVQADYFSGIKRYRIVKDTIRPGKNT